jgi:hypothetical protein
MPYYNNGKMLDTHITEYWSKYSPEVRQNLRVIIVDDGSTQDPAENHLKGPMPVPVTLYKVMKDIPWNQHGARNLGFHVAREGWCLATDMDHAVPNEFLEKVMSEPLADGCFYTFNRELANGEPNNGEKGKSHKNSFLIEKNTFWNGGGYDEDFCGTYGGDSWFRASLERVALHVHRSDLNFIRYTATEVQDCSTTQFSRQGKSRDDFKRIFDRKRRSGKNKPVSPLRFPWKKVGEFTPQGEKRNSSIAVYPSSIPPISKAALKRFFRTY